MLLLLALIPSFSWDIFVTSLQKWKYIIEGACLHFQLSFMTLLLHLSTFLRVEATVWRKPSLDQIVAKSWPDWASKYHPLTCMRSRFVALPVSGTPGNVATLIWLWPIHLTSACHGLRCPDLWHAVISGRATKASAGLVLIAMTYWDDPVWQNMSQNGECMKHVAADGWHVWRVGCMTGVGFGTSSCLSFLWHVTTWDTPQFSFGDISISDFLRVRRKTCDVSQEWWKWADAPNNLWIKAG